MVIGVTGGIGSGKSTVCRILEVLGYKVYISDSRAASLMSSDRVVIEQIKSEFGEESYIDGKLNNNYLSQQVFGNSKRLRKLESFVHPAVFRDIDRFKEQNSEEIVFIESAILFESGLDKKCDKIIAVSAPEELRISRVIKRDSSNREKIEKRIAAQMSDSERESRSHFIIRCDEHNSLFESIQSILNSTSNVVK